MGLLASKVWNYFTSIKDCRIILLGLDAAGKTTITYKMKLGEVLSSTPTIGFNVETIEFRNIKFNIWDIGGQTKLRSLWRHYFPNTNGIIFVIDSSDRARIGEAKKEIDFLMQDEDLKGCPQLILANKLDLGVMSVAEVIDKLDLQSIRGRDWFCQGCSALTGTGLYEGFDWMGKRIHEISKKKGRY